MDPNLQHLGLAVLIGLLVGLQREHSGPGTAGMRTFVLVSLLGAICGLLAGAIGGWIVAAGLLGVTSLVVVGHFARLTDGESHGGTTTDAALLLVFALGATLTATTLTVPALVVGATLAVLLQFKPELHGIAQRLGDRDLRAIMQFVLITGVILPILHPIPALDPLGVIRPFEVWLMVVLIVGLSLAGYIAYKFVGENAGILLSGVLGGAISSTATTVSCARDARQSRAAIWSVAVIVLVASTVMVARIAVAVGAIAPDFLWSLAPALGVLGATTLIPALAVWLFLRRGAAAASTDAADSTAADSTTAGRGETTEAGEAASTTAGAGENRPRAGRPHANPTQMRSALIFATAYAVVKLALAYAQTYFGGAGLYVVATLSGFTDLDAITLSTAQMSATDSWVAAHGWELIVLAVMANSVAKTAIAGLLGGWRLALLLAAGFALSFAGGAALLLLLR